MNGTDTKVKAAEHEAGVQYWGQQPPQPPAPARLGSSVRLQSSSLHTQQKQPGQPQPPPPPPQQQPQPTGQSQQQHHQQAALPQQQLSGSVNGTSKPHYDAHYFNGSSQHSRLLNRGAGSAASSAYGQFNHEPAFGSPLDFTDVPLTRVRSALGMGPRSSICSTAQTGGLLDDELGEEAPEMYRTAVIKTLMSVGAACLFGICTWVAMGQRSGMEFFAGYLVEQSLSVDNLFVFIMLFDYFAVPVQFQSRVLTWGIIGAVVMRGIMIGLGVAIVKQFRWIIIIFAGILLVSSWKLLQEGDEDHDLSNNTVVKLAKRMVGAVDEYDGDRFFTRKLGGGRRVATPLLLCLVCIELSDFVFAVDSIPAVLGVSHDPFVVYSSNIFAIMGLRSVYTIIARAIDQLPYLKPAVALVLGFVGCKMIAEFFHVEVSTGVSLLVVVALIGGGVGLSVAKAMCKANKRKNSDSTLFQATIEAGSMA